MSSITLLRQSAHAMNRRFISAAARKGLSSKVVDSVEDAIAGVKSGDTILVGGFGVCGTPHSLLSALAARKDIKDLTLIGNNAGVDGWGMGPLLDSQTRRVVISYVGGNKTFEQKFLKGEIECELVPQGTLAEKIRCGGAGIPGFLTPTGVGTLVHHGGIPIRFNNDGSVAEVSQPKESKIMKGREYLLEESIVADYAFIKAWKADSRGNLALRGTAINFNPIMAMAAKCTVVEVEEIVENLGDIKPQEVDVPSIYVHRVWKAPPYKKYIENLRNSAPKDIFDTPSAFPSSVLNPDGTIPLHVIAKMSSRERIVRRAALEFQDGMYVNLGIGMPTLASNFMPPGIRVDLEAENGLLGTGPYPLPGEEDADMINAGKETVTALPGAAVFSSAQSFAMIRGKHMDMTVLGGLEVSQSGDLANWIVPGKMVKGMGGAMDLVSSGSRVVVTLEHTQKGKSKILPQTTLPVTGRNCVDRIITDLAVFDVDKQKKELELIEIAAGVTLEDIQKNTLAKYRVSPSLKVMPLSTTGL